LSLFSSLRQTRARVSRDRSVQFPAQFTAKSIIALLAVVAFMAIFLTLLYYFFEYMGKKTDQSDIKYQKSCPIENTVTVLASLSKVFFDLIQFYLIVLFSINNFDNAIDTDSLGQNPGKHQKMLSNTVKLG